MELKRTVRLYIPMFESYIIKHYMNESTLYSIKSQLQKTQKRTFTDSTVSILTSHIITKWRRMNKK